MTTLDAALDAVAEGHLVPYLGAEAAQLCGGTVPASPAALAAVVEAQVRPPKRISGDLSAVAQFVETRRHRRTLETIVTAAFAGGATPSPLHRWLAACRPPLVVDTWYDDALLRAFAGGAAGWGWVQGVDRRGAAAELWTRAFDAAGTPRPDGPDPAWTTLIYKPHGLIRPGSAFLLSDSDYVEVLTEIDIQTPIPAEVQARRGGRGFLFLGCRFDDQVLRTFARQITKRSSGPRVAVLAGSLSRMEARFLEATAIERIDASLDAVTAALDARRLIAGTG